MVNSTKFCVSVCYTLCRISVACVVYTVYFGLGDFTVVCLCFWMTKGVSRENLSVINIDCVWCLIITRFTAYVFKYCEIKCQSCDGTKPSLITTELVFQHLFLYYNIMLSCSQDLQWNYCTNYMWTWHIKPNTHRRRDSTVASAVWTHSSA